MIDDILPWLYGLWFITIPLSIFITYIVVTEFLDLIFNRNKINQLYKRSRLVNLDILAMQYRSLKERQQKLDQSNLKELDRQIQYYRQIIRKNSWTPNSNFDEKERIKAAKEISDVFKIS